MRKTATSYLGGMVALACLVGVAVSPSVAQESFEPIEFYDWWVFHVEALDYSKAGSFYPEDPVQRRADLVFECENGAASGRIRLFEPDEKAERGFQVVQFEDNDEPITLEVELWGPWLGHVNPDSERITYDLTPNEEGAALLMDSSQTHRLTSWAESVDWIRFWMDGNGYTVYTIGLAGALAYLPCLREWVFSP